MAETLAEMGARRMALRKELAELTEQIRVKALADLAAGRSEAQVAREGCVDRMWVRKWLGKRPEKP